MRITRVGAYCIRPHTNGTFFTAGNHKDFPYGAKPIDVDFEFIVYFTHLIIFIIFASTKKNSILIFLPDY